MIQRLTAYRVYNCGYPLSSSTDADRVGLRQSSGAIRSILIDENRILHVRILDQIRMTLAEWECLLKFGLPIACPIDEFISIVTPKTSYC